MSEQVMERIPFFDLQEQYREIEGEIKTALDKVLSHTAFVDGPFVAQFEREFAEYFGMDYAVGVNSGTSALMLALHTLNLQPGDEVIVPANTFIATAYAVSLLGGTPVFADCRRDTWNLDPESAAARISPKTKGIIAVHLYGAPADLDPLSDLCEQNGLWLVEDCAQSHGAKYKEKLAGTFGRISCFSFYPGKNLGAYGQGGACLTNDQALAARMRKLRNYGSPERYHFDEIGWNLRMDGFQAAVLSVKLRHLNRWNQQKQVLAQRYQAGLPKSAGKYQCQPEWADSVYHLFVVMNPRRDELIQYLNAQQIFPGIHYPIPCHLQKAYAELGYVPGDCPNAEALAAQCLSLPMFPELKEAQVDRVIEVVKGF